MFPIWNFFANRVPVELSKNAIPTIELSNDDRKDFVQKGQVGLPYWTMILATCVSVKRVQMFGHSDFGNFNKVRALSILSWVLDFTASAAFPAHPGALVEISITFAIVNC